MDQNKSSRLCQVFGHNDEKNEHKNIDITLNVLIKISSKWEDNENFGI